MIHIDYREPPEMEKWFKEECIEIELRREQLLVGDYLIQIDEKIVPIERKTAQDYTSSLFSKHLSNQLFFLSQNFSESFLIVTGSFHELLINGGISRHALIASRVSAVTKRANSGSKGRVNIIPLESDFDIPYCLFCLHTVIEEGNSIRFLSLEGKKTGNDWLLSMYAGLPGIGIERAKDIAKRFPSLVSLVNASVGEILEVNGVGKTLAKQIFEKIRYEVRI